MGGEATSGTASCVSAAGDDGKRLAHDVGLQQKQTVYLHFRSVTMATRSVLKGQQVVGSSFNTVTLLMAGVISSHPSTTACCTRVT